MMSTDQHRETDSEVPGSARPLRILLISQWFDPEPTFKGQLFAEELKRQGHDVRVLTGFPNYPGGKIYDGYRIRLFQRECVGGIPILRVPLYPSHDGSGLRRAINYLSFAATATLGALLTRRPDVAYVYHPPATSAIPAMALKLIKGVPFVYDVQDLWPDTLAATGMLTRPSLLDLIGRVMRGVYRRASGVVVLSEGFREALVARSVPRRQIQVIPNWADEKQIDLSQPAASRARELGFEGKFTVTFAGNLGRAQSLETVLDAAELLREHQDIRFLFVGGGVDSESLRRQAEERNLPNVEFLPRRPIFEIGEILALSDALLVHLRDDPLFAITIPSKTQAYLMAGKPILMGVRGDAARIMEQASAGISFEPENPAELASAVLALTNLGRRELTLMGQRGREFYREHMSLAVGAQSFSQVLRNASLVRPYTAACKRAIDLVVSGTGLVLLSLPMGVVALLIRRKLGSPVLFRQQRPGRYGEPFRMFKFRTMSDERNERGELLPDRSRISAFGAALRATSIDEFPELINVWRGEMSLVGPRPLLMRYTDYFTEEERLRFIVRPGITGLAQVDGRNTASWDKRLALDVRYVRRLSIANDLKILALTISRVFHRSGVVVDPESIMLNLDDERRIAKSR